MTTHIPALVVGAGISGLVCGYALRRAGIDAQVVEASKRAGGLIRSERCEGYLLELGPQSFSGTAQLSELCRQLGIHEQLLDAPARAPRFLLLKGKLQPVPLSPPAFFASSLFRARTKWSLLRDVLGRSTPPTTDESMADFTRRKFTPELLEKLVGPFVSGIYAGDPEKLSLRAAFPQVYEAEKAAGSIVRGMVRLAKAKRKVATAKSSDAGSSEKARRTLQTFRDGNETLVRALAEALGPALRTETCVSEIRRNSSSSGSPAAESFAVALHSKRSVEEIVTGSLVLATPPDVTARLLASVSPEISSALGGIEHAPVAVVSLGYAQSAVGASLEGFGFLIPRSEGRRTLGTVWNSSLFRGRALAGHVLLTSFVGGATDPAATALSERELAALVHGEIAPVLQIQSNPAFSQVTIYSRALPQYNLGHTERLATAEQAAAEIPGLFLAGNYWGGPAIGTCVEQALEVADLAGRRMERAAKAVRS